MFIPIYDLNKKKHIKYQYVTAMIIAINILVWLIGATDPNNGEAAQSAVFFNYGFIPALANELAILPVEHDFLPHWSRYVTYSFFHGDFLHLAGNMLFLWVFGDNVEDAMGHFRFLLFYFVCAFSGALAYSLAYPDSQSPLIGASAAASGVVVAYMMLHPRVKVWVLLLARIPLRISAIWILGGWIVYQVYSLASDTTGEIAWASHLGGIVAGAILVYLLKRRDVALFNFEVPGNSTQSLTEIKQVAEMEPPGDIHPDNSVSSATPSHQWGRQK